MPRRSLYLRGRKRLKENLDYPENSAGRIMNTEFLAFYEGVAVKEAIQRLRHLVRRKEKIEYVYVLDQENRLVGVLMMRDLMLADSAATLNAVMHKDVFSVPAHMDREDLIHILSEKRYLSVPVVDAENRILGTVRTNELLVHTEEEATEDLQKMFGAGGDERVFSPLWYTVTRRHPWLQVNLATAFLAAFVISFFEEIIAQVTMLAVFLPVVAGQGGNSGAQSLAVVMRGLVTREIPPKLAGRVIMKEALAGAINGIVIGTVTGVIAWIWGENVFLGLVIALAMVVNMVCAGLAGAAIPITMKKLGFDPAQSSNIILTTVTDVVGFFAFLGLAALFYGYLV